MGKNLASGAGHKGFAVAAPNKAHKLALRAHDVKEKKLHVPMIDRTPDVDPPPVIVAVVGPPGTGKTTLIRSLVRILAKTTLTDIRGPITLVSGKRRRLTFIEVSNDLSSMVDIAKIADLVLLLIDGNFGFEMETMEFLNIAQHHGMPRVLAIATHLDLFKSQSTLRTSKKRLKTRLWTEVYKGAKLFYLSGVLNGRYPDREVFNLSRFISTMKFRPLKWRNEHPYLLADRVTDLTHPTLIEKNKKCDRKIAIYGYLHGTPLSSSNPRVHIAGCGDVTIQSIEKLVDPCPTPHFEEKLDELQREAQKNEDDSSTTTKRKTRRKRLNDRQKIIYAPMSDVGGVLVDKDAVYIDVGENKSRKKDAETEKLVASLQEANKTLDDEIRSSPSFRLFSNSKEINGVEDLDSDNLDDEPQGLLDELDSEEQINNTGRKTLRKPTSASKIRGDDDDDDDDDDYNRIDEEEEDFERKRFQRIRTEIYESNEKEKLEFEEDSDIGLSDDSYDSDGNNWKKQARKLQGTVTRKWDINKLLYANNIEPEDVIDRVYNRGGDESEEEDIEEEDFFKKKIYKEPSNEFDSYKPHFSDIEMLKNKWIFDNNNSNIDKEDSAGNSPFALISRRFILSKKMIGEDDSGDNQEVGDDSDEELYGDFEDLETEEKFGSDDKKRPLNKKLRDSDDDNDDFADFDAEERKDENGEEEEPNMDEDFKNLTVEEKRALTAKKKEQLRLQFEAEEGGGEFGIDDPEGNDETWYDIQKAKMAKQLEINKAELTKMDVETRTKIEGYTAGSYVKLTFERLPYEFIENFDPVYPIIIGGLLQTEERFGILNARIRRHRWHKKILKTSDPLILSLGWRRFQTLPIYTTSDSRTRTRMLKYTPEHAYCNVSFYGPLIAPNTTFCGMQILANSDTTGSFRIAATGIIEEIDSSVEIVKKLKLVGYPYKIYRNTAFIKDMFSTSLEVAKFEGASIKTVSGIRGEIKRALSKPDGYFRATFEDKILMSDIVFLRTWYPVKIKKFYNPVTSLLIRDKKEWKGMRLVGKLRADLNQSIEMNPNSSYEKVAREERRFNPLRVPKSLQKELPFKSQIVQMKPQKNKTYMQKRAVVLNGDERKARDIIHKVSTIRKNKDEKRKAKRSEKNKDRLKRLEKKNAMIDEKQKERKKDFFANSGKKRKLFSSDSDAFGKKRRS
ncbi:GTPase BMS1 [Ascoidea rubescens DSM 1968]|uniref:DUF663-domain-containing protein n=1 Tax=Ascoidea rubescens DSM 1968 TaxID=1344418 RepID=A0A1D2VB27_9ASCO|nr:DUF663-domain-containing protein [Ascoidea rubescens DSM 1968]ODV58904.1 DUF663-domain-containing protein [Ascoidea rubescens DSM 1968]